MANRKRVSYEKQMRDKAMAEQEGLVTLDVIDPGKAVGKFGGRRTIQGQFDKTDSRRIHEFFLWLITRSNAG